MKKFFLSLLTCLLPFLLNGQFISEIHYDNTGTDAGEFIEVCIPSTFTGNLSDLTVSLINGSGCSSYDMLTVDLFTVGSTDANGTYYTWYPTSIQNGPDGIQLDNAGSIVEELFYEGLGSCTTGTVIGVSEPGAIGESLQLVNGVWTGPSPETPGEANLPPTFDCPTEMVNFGDACDDGDVATTNDIIQNDCTCAGTVPTFDCPTDMTNFGDACDDGDAGTTNDIIQSDCSCAGTTIMAGSCPTGAKINEFHYDNAGTDMNEFVEIAVPVGDDGTQITISLYNGSNGTEYGSYTLSASDLVSSDATFDYYVWSVSMQNGNDGIALSCADGTQIQFITYEGAFAATDGPFAGVTGIDIGVAESGTTTTDSQSIQCDGSGVYSVDCASTPGATNDLSTCGVVTFDCPTEMVNFGDACDDGDVATTNDVIQADCTCAGTIAPIFDCPIAMANFGDACDDGDAGTTNDIIQSDCSCAGTMIMAGSCPTGAKINEFHYDNAGTDMNEFVEIAVPVGDDGTQITISLYNGSNGTEYGSYTLSASDLVSSDATFDYYVWSVSMQNGNDGIALSCADGTQIQFITYEGAFAATDGPFAGVTGIDIGVAESGTTTTDSQSIQCDGSGVYSVDCASTPGATNDLSTCGVVTFDCPTEMVNFGDACDDGDAATTNDVIQADCTCAGTMASGCGIVDLGAATIACNAETDGADAVTVSIPYTGMDADVTITNNGSGTIGGDDPAAVTDGTITITLLEGETYDITVSGGVCAGFNATGTIDALECAPVQAACDDLFIGNCDATPTVIDFEGFDGSGFSTNPLPGQLCSQNWASTGFSDGAFTFGDIADMGDYANDTTSGGVSGGGIYAYIGGGATALWIQSTGSDFTPGTITLKVCNNSGGTMTDINIAYDLLILNNEARASLYSFAYSIDDVTYTPVAALDTAGGDVADGMLTTVNQATTLSGINLADGGCLYLQFSSDDFGGSGSRDEFGLDNISICAGAVEACDSNAGNFPWFDTGNKPANTNSDSGTEGSN